MDSEKGRAEKYCAGILRKPGARVYLIGIKGTGMCALAELLLKGGAVVSGSDGDEVFYTDAILKELGIPFFECFDAAHIDPSFDIVIHSAAYSFGTNPEMDEARKLFLPIFKYTDALGAYSAGADSSGICGVHGKTTTTALAGTMLRGVGAPAEILAGSGVGSFGGRSTLSMGSRYFVAETCEYRRHFLSFHPKRIVLTSVEWDHQDYFSSYDDIRDAFLEYARLLPPDGELIYCADDPGAAEVAGLLEKENLGIKLVPYGFNAEGEYKITKYKVRDDRVVMALAGFPGDLRIPVPGRHTALNAAAALALTSSIVSSYAGGWNDERREGLRNALDEFYGSSRRSEVLGEAGGILFMDDYGHHPTEIKTTLAGLKEFYPRRRLVVSFMSHTYTRTAALLNDFASSFEDADIVILHKIYSSAREQYQGGITGKTLFEKTREKFFSSTSEKILSEDRVFYLDEPDNGMDLLKSILKPGDLFITMGAGDNFRLGRKIYEYFCNHITLRGNK